MENFTVKHIFSRQGLWLLIILASMGLVACESSILPEPASSPPNILLIMTDDQGWGDLSFHGNDSIHTPVLDQLARQSVRLNRFYVSPVCAPTRASLLTGRYHLRTGTSFVTARRETMRTEETTLAEILKAHGYATGLFGKWHNGEHYPQDPIGQGFDTFLGFAAGHWNNYFNTTLMENGDSVETSGYITNVLTDRALEFIDQQQDRPFFCYVPYNAPHSPFQVPDEYFNKYKAMGLTDKNAAVYGMVENIDDQVGRLLDRLDSLGLSDNTIVIFLTDNGPNGDRYNGGMRGRKGSVHEGGVRVPCFIRWPQVLPANQETDILSAHIDLFPTLLDLAGLTVPDMPALDGRSLVPWLQDPSAAPPARTLYTVHMSWDTMQAVGALRNDHYRMVVEWDGETQLYDMHNDPGQRTDLAGQFPKLSDSLRQAYNQWLTEVRANGLRPPPIEVGHTAAPSVFLPAPEAQLRGDLSYRGDGWANDWIINWTGPGDRASWPLQVVETGRYEVILHYNLPADAQPPLIHLQAGKKSLQTTIEQSFVGQQIDSPDRLVRGEVYEKSWGAWSVGWASLPIGRAELSVRVLKAGEGLEVKGVMLRRVAERIE